MTNLPWTAWARACKKGEIPDEWQEILNESNNVGLYGERRERHPDPPLGACQWCGGQVFCTGGWAARRMLPRKKYCSGRCSIDAYLARRRERRAQAREKTCEVCAKEFTAKRRDAKTCSAACKQKAYRRRQQKEAA
jgi:hypothetical protein